MTAGRASSATPSWPPSCGSGCPRWRYARPAILPGGSRTSALASIAESSGVSGAGMVSALIRLASLFWPGPRRIRARVLGRVPAAEPGTRVTVLLEDARTGPDRLRPRPWPAVDLHVAASMVAGYIARQIFAVDRTVPKWCYGAADGRDLGAMQLARMERVLCRLPLGCRSSPRADQITILRQGYGDRPVRGNRPVRAGPALRAERAVPGVASACTRLNRELHPRFYRGRYRLAMSLEMARQPGALPARIPMSRGTPLRRPSRFSPAAG